MNETSLATQKRSDITTHTGQPNDMMAVVQTTTGRLAIPGHDQEFRYRLPRLGKIHLGVKKRSASGAEYPTETPFFVLPDNLRQNKDFREALEAMGQDPDKPTVLPIRFATNSMSVNMSRSWDAYNSSHVLLSRWDGQTCSSRPNAGSPMVSQTCFEPGRCPQCVCDPKNIIHRLKICLPDAPDIGVWQIDFKSKQSFANIDTEAAIKLRALGKIAGIDFLLSREPEMVEQTIEDKNNKGQSRITNVLHYRLHLRSQFSQRKLEEMAKDAIVYDSADVEGFDYSTDNDIPVYEETDFDVGTPPGVDTETGEIIEASDATIEAEQQDDIRSQCSVLMLARAMTPAQQKNLCVRVTKRNGALVENMTDDELNLLLAELNKV